jgi:hypothetical protein
MVMVMVSQHLCRDSGPNLDWTGSVGILGTLLAQLGRKVVKLSNESLKHWAIKVGKGVEDEEALDTQIRRNNRLRARLEVSQLFADYAPFEK